MKEIKVGDKIIHHEREAIVERIYDNGEAYIKFVSLMIGKTRVGKIISLNDAILHSKHETNDG